ncbi:MAG TPA: TlpA disulfide reductase family protein [Candidatus Sulfomarinibacteraceae bacterium]|nr:TlpA disulfide reductase family protein [Candidatus Sulfomarinibacteraceae bacterium]
METTQVVRPGLRTPGGERLRTLVIMLVVGAAIAGVAYLLDRTGATNYTTIELTGDTSGPRPVVGGTPPDFSATTVDGAAFRLADLAGRPIWLTFGASWCADCRAEAPDLQATYERYAPAGLAVVSIWLQESDREVRDYAARVGLNFTMIADPSTALASRYRTYGLPTHFFIGPDGTIREVRLGGLPPQEMDRLVRSILQ